MAQQTSMTAVEWFYDILTKENWEYKTYEEQDIIFQKVKQMEEDQIKEDLLGFQIYLNNKGLITNYDWYFEKLAKQYIKKEYK